ncbi:MAG: LapA family protein [Nitrospirota bacterium]
MTIFTVIVVIIAVLTIFLLQNSAPVAISFLFWKFEASLAIVLFLSVLGGVVIALLTVFSLRLKRSFKKKNGNDP